MVSGIVFGRTDEIAAADKSDFQRSGMWHLLRWVSSGQNAALGPGRLFFVGSAAPLMPLNSPPPDG